MMTIDLRNNKYHQKTVILNRSKSIYIRYLFAHFIYTGAILPIGDEEAEDVKVTAKVLENIKKRRDNRGTTIVDVDDCGTAFRFCIALLSITQGDWLLTGSKKLLSRPFLPLVTSLKKSGASIMLVDHGILIKGKTIQAEQMEIDCSQSSQFASAILLIGERIGLKKMIIIPQNVPSLPYLILTKEVIKRVTQNTHAFSIEDIESDWSGALFWYALCSLSSGSAFVFKNLSLDSLQGDAIISRWFNQLDVETTPLGKDIMIRHKVSPIIPPHDLSFDLLQHPDLAPVLSILLLLKEKESTLTGLQNLNFKESNRFDLIFNTLHQFSEVSVLDDNTLTIKQPKAPQNEQLLFCSHQDHRWVMAFLLFAVHNVIEMDDVECLKKSYPLFWSNF